MRFRLAPRSMTLNCCKSTPPFDMLQRNLATALDRLADMISGRAVEEAGTMNLFAWVRWIVTKLRTSLWTVVQTGRSSSYWCIVMYRMY